MDVSRNLVQGQWDVHQNHINDLHAVLANSQYCEGKQSENRGGLILS